MQLFYSPTSPYARNTALVARHHHLMDDIEIIKTNPLEDPIALRNANPLGKVPALILDDGRVLFDSNLIVYHLNEIGTGPDLFSRSDLLPWEAQRLYALANGVLDLAVAWRLESMRPADEQSASWQSRRIAGIDQAVKLMAASVPPKQEMLSMIDLSFGTTLDYLDFRLPQLKWQEKWPQMADWCREVVAVLDFQDTDPRKA